MDIVKILEAAVAQVPALVVMVIMVWMFLGYMKEQRREFNLMIKALHEDHLDARSMTRAVITAQNQSFQEFAKALIILSEAVKSCNAATKPNESKRQCQ